MMKKGPNQMSAEEFDDLFQKVRNWGRWGPNDEKGTLNYITPAHIRAAVALVRSGRSISLAAPLSTVAGPDNPRPAAHYMTQMYGMGSTLVEPQFVADYWASEVHGDCPTHIDAPCHVAYKGELYNGKPTSSVTADGPTLMDITTYAHGIVGRGVLLDIPRLRKVKWLELGETVTSEELEAAEQAQGVRLGEGDIFLFRSGHYRRRIELGSWNSGYDGEGKVGLHPTTMLMLHERKVAAFLPESDGETIPSNVEGVASPIHALQIAAMGMACADNLQFEDLVKACEEERRWEFMVVIAPLRLPRGTGSLFNPIAIF